ncbi:CpXC domain-containing protein [Ruminococcus flavefaciens]|uniref:CpXC domain-containing protein n=1 Tax=Ruminococcus flavefaciens TaxID=1265 RepID=UPI00030431DE|nr:CpXC domain-containing protein [Ruminococcus flavefaciens]
MSKNHIEKIKCPKCGKVSDMLVWELIDTSQDPQMAEQIRNGDAFSWYCPGCDNKSLIFYPTIYHEVDKKYVLAYVPGDPTSAVGYMKDLNSNNDSGYDFSIGYTKRIVTDMNKLREKLLILDHDLDDKIIELMKLFIIADLQDRNPDLKVKDIFFNVNGEGKYCFAVIFDNDRWGESEFVQNSYDQVAKTFMKDLVIADEFIIDTEWAMSILNKNL